MHLLLVVFILTHIKNRYKNYLDFLLDYVSIKLLPAINIFSTFSRISTAYRYWQLQRHFSEYLYKNQVNLGICVVKVTESISKKYLAKNKYSTSDFVFIVESVWILWCIWSQESEMTVICYRSYCKEEYDIQW